MNLTQNDRLNQVTADTLVVGVDIGPQEYFARAFDWRGFEFSKRAFKFGNTNVGFQKFLQEHDVLLVTVNPYSVKKCKELDDNSPEKSDLKDQKTAWNVNGDRYDNASLEPDTIMLCGSNVYILDAKYYKFGVTGKAWDLPESTSINKQITYGKYVANEERFKKKHGNDIKVYNAFLMLFLQMLRL